jgi:hypothetical protein
MWIEKTFRKRWEAVYPSHELRMMIDHGKLYEIPKRKYQLNVLTFDRTAELTQQEPEENQFEWISVGVQQDEL